MAQGKSQTATGKAVYLLHEPLRVRNAETGERSYYQVGEKRTAGELEGLILPALEQGGFIEKVEEAQFSCEACIAHGTQQQKKARYLAEELANHYRKEHPALALPEEV